MYFTQLDTLRFVYTYPIESLNSTMAGSLLLSLVLTQ